MPSPTSVPNTVEGTDALYQSVGLKPAEDITLPLTFVRADDWISQLLDRWRILVVLAELTLTVAATIIIVIVSRLMFVLSLQPNCPYNAVLIVPG